MRYTRALPWALSAQQQGVKMKKSPDKLLDAKKAGVDEKNEEIPLLDCRLTLLDDLVYFTYHLVRHANLLWLGLFLLGVLVLKAGWMALFLVVPILGYPITALLREIFFSPGNHIRLAQWFTNTRRLFFFSNPSEESLKEFDKALKSDDIAIRAMAYLFRGLQFAEEKNFDKATRDLEQTIDLDPWNAKAFYGLGIILQESGDHQKAQEKYSEALQRENNLHKLMESWEPNFKSFLKAKGQMWRRVPEKIIMESLKEVTQ